MTRAFLRRGGAVVARLAHNQDVGGSNPPPASDDCAAEVRGGGAVDPAARGWSPAELAGALALTLGGLAFTHGKSLDDNCYVADSGHHIVWRHGWRCASRGHEPLRRREPRRNVQRETRRPGRGRAVQGRRSEWSAPEDEALLLLADRLSAAELADMTDRSIPSVRARLCRLRKALRQAQDEGRAA